MTPMFEQDSGSLRRKNTLRPDTLFKYKTQRQINFVFFGPKTSRPNLVLVFVVSGWMVGRDFVIQPFCLGPFCVLVQQTFLVVGRDGKEGWVDSVEVAKCEHNVWAWEWGRACCSLFPDTWHYGGKLIVSITQSPQSLHRSNERLLRQDSFPFVKLKGECSWWMLQDSSTLPHPVWMTTLTMGNYSSNLSCCPSSFSPPIDMMVISEHDWHDCIISRYHGGPRHPDWTALASQD